MLTREAGLKPRPTSVGSSAANVARIFISAKRSIASERQRASHANGSAPLPFDFAQGVVSVVEPRSGARESVSGSPRGEAPRLRLSLA